MTTLLIHYNNLYIIDSEPVLQRRYADLSLLVRPEMRRYHLHDILLEFKYLSLSSLKLSGQGLKEKAHPNLLTLEVVKDAIDQAKHQLQRYRKTLLAKYGSNLQLRAYAVLALGLERVIWVKVP